MRRLEQQVLQPGRTCPFVYMYMAYDRVVSKGRSYCPYYYPARCVGNPPAKRTQQRHVQLQVRLWNLCRDLTTGQKTIAEFLCGEDGTSDSITKIIAKETINIMNIYNFKLEIFNVCMFIIISLRFVIYFICYLLYDL